MAETISVVDYLTWVPTEFNCPDDKILLEELHRTWERFKTRRKTVMYFICDKYRLW